jgi:MoaA/NifB/PqqE/SkfB family radical SAM enzyme
VTATNLRASLRLAPAEKLATHPQFADYLAGKRVYPVNVEVSPSGACQATCDGCWFARGDVGGHRKVFLDTKRALDLLWEFSELEVKSVSWTGGGEPSLHPEIGKLVDSAAAAGLEQGMFTNALAAPRFDPARLAWARVTMTDKPYRAEHIRRLRPAKTLGFAFNYAGPEALEYLWETLHLAEDVGADYVQVRPMLKFHGMTVAIEPPAIEHPLLHVTGYKFDEAKKPHGYGACEGYHFAPFVWETGEVHACAYQRPYVEAGRREYALGDVYESSFKEIMDRAAAGVPVHGGCQVACKLHEINQAVHRARALLDRNFP